MGADVKIVDAVIAASAQVSQPIPFEEYHTISLWMPDAWTTANLTLQTSLSGPEPAAESAWRNVWTDAAELSLPVAANRVVSVQFGLMVPAGARWIRLVSGTSASRVTQVAARTITAAFRRF
jgi:hypothetical protein